MPSERTPRRARASIRERAGWARGRDALLRLFPGAGPREPPDPAAPAQLAARCAALLRGGVPAARVFTALESEPAHTAGSRIAARVAAGEPPPVAIAAEDAPPWRVLAVAWHLAAESGAPLAPALDRIGGALRELERLGERRDVLLSGPRATVRLVSALPLLTFGLGALLGFNPLPVLLSGAGAALFGVGTALLLAGVAWARALRQRVEHADRVDGDECELLWIALGGGAAPALATLRVADAVDAYGAEWVRFDSFIAGGVLATTVRAAAATGVALRPLLLEQAAERLGVRVLVPLGVCVLPAFIAIGVAPVVIAMLGGL
ncbi:type II secretion system F family protein [Leucobacter luti]|uniref:Tight adherence protein B n=1 Tax=Leucobacter luti TaxID=340320 RepID=A0A4Q7TYY1_9MICO|nr:type II secretion system F family protein [Leucobacter luti]MBL3699011.1 hypothetical protein [Leucobacter luti]RZT66391.1 tight adherence protein B [Leucobacter luti]